MGEIRWTMAGPRPVHAGRDREEAHAGRRSPIVLLVLAVVLFAVVLFAVAFAQPAGQADTRHPVAYAVEGLGAWVRSEVDPARLRTPQSALETFLEAGEAERFDLAARALNLYDVPADQWRERGPQLAEKLHFVLARELAIDWSALPDRPDGADDLSRTRSAGDGQRAASVAPSPRRNLLVGSLNGTAPPVEVRLERVQSPDLPPVWLIARSTVARTEALYDRYGPGWLQRTAPGRAIEQFARAPISRWLLFVALVVAAAGIGSLLQRIVQRSMASSQRPWMRGLASEVARPLALLAGLAAFWLASAGLPSLTGPPARWVASMLAVLFVVALTWLGTSAIDFFSEYVGKHHVDSIAAHDQRRARRRLTYLSVARRASSFVLVIVGVGAALAQFGALRALGASLLASAGVAGILLGIAAQGSLANLMAGVQIALTQLVQIGDTVFFEEEWAYVEDITYTFVILKTWDERRIAVPNRYVISHPLENWEMTSSHMVMPIRFYVDHRTPVDDVRRRYVELLEASDDWDRQQEPRLQVIAAGEDVLKLQALCSAEDPATAWRLACHLREELLAFLSDWEEGRFLPRQRVIVEGRAPDPASETPEAS